ncbi:MAG: hypothetical protein VKJ64_04280 [Leptolyngbyaceae bacterium]|nr:hypothetical protein [Leptolyngbyaceae bacterium]
MLLAFTSDLSDGLMVIGLIAMMSLIVCPLFIWVLTCDLPFEPSTDPSALRGKVS